MGLLSGLSGWGTQLCLGSESWKNLIVQENADSKCTLHCLQLRLMLMIQDISLETVPLSTAGHKVTSKGFGQATAKGFTSPNFVMDTNPSDTSIQIQTS